MTGISQTGIERRGGAASAEWGRLAVEAGVLGGLLLALYWNVVNTLVIKWSRQGDWSHGFLIPLFSLYYLYMQRDRFPGGSRRTGYLGLGVLLAGYALYLYGALWQIGYYTSLSLVISIFGTVYLACGWPIARWAWFAIAFLVFALPLPGQVYEQITMPLQKIASKAAALVLNVLPGMDARAENIVITYLYKGSVGALNVEQACSGIRLMMAFVALGVAMAFASERPLWHRMVMILSCIPISIFCNMIRVTTTGLFVVFGQEELAHGFYHTLLGLAMLLIAFSLFGAISYVLGHLFVEAPDAHPGEQAKERDA